MPIQSVQRLYVGDPLEEVGIRLHGIGKDGMLEILYQDIPGNSWNSQRLKKLVTQIQDLIDVRTPLADLPIGDPDKTTDPGLPNHFWDSGDLVARSIVIRDAWFDDTVQPNGRLRFTIIDAKYT